MSVTTPAPTTIDRIRLRVVLRGTVQGVGFRPYVHRRATALGLCGWVANSGDGVVIEAEGPARRVARLIEQLREAPPARARILAIETVEMPVQGEDGPFAIRISAAGGMQTVQVLPDLAPCAQCLAETLDPANRRHRYPFTNCTHCGPRYSIVERLPYDRERTTMRRFAMCADCRAEYEDPADRRFHAEPNGCPACGPRLALHDTGGTLLASGDDALAGTVAALRRGLVVALKGIGGFQLLVAAQDEAAVRRLRQRKRRPDKPFAVLFAAAAAVRDCCRVDSAEDTLLCSPERPIVLLERRADSGLGAVAPAVAPDCRTLGAMLPASPLHHLLALDFGAALVATSGNVADDPIVIDESDAFRRLGAIADLFLVHDRPIARPLDDSVARIVCGRELLLRRARGYAPAAVPVAGLRAGVAGFGGHLKTTVALTRERDVVVGAHVGDQDTLTARAAHARSVADLAHLHAIPLRCAVHDLHPDYATTVHARSAGLPTLAVQHHLAHVIAGVADNAVPLPVLGIAWDGGGQGTDGSIWGGECLLVQANGWHRVARLRRFRLPGGETAVREPRRAAIGLLFEALGTAALDRTDLAPVAAFTAAERAVLRTMLDRGLNAPFASSVGRLFDAFAALTGELQRCSYEGQAAMRLEAAVQDTDLATPYPFPLRTVTGASPDDASPLLEIDWQPALAALLADLRAGSALHAIAAALHAGLAAAAADVARQAGVSRVVLSGGCFQNARLTAATVAALREAGFEPHWHRRIPPNDGGIALGQAVWAAWHPAPGTR